MFEPSFTQEFNGSGGLRPSIHGGADETGGGLVGLVDKLLDTLTRWLEPGGDAGVLPGIHVLDSNIHPLIVHFPIAFLSVFFLLEIIGVSFRRESLRKTAGAMLYCGALGALAAVAAGLHAASIVPHGEAVHEIMERHEQLGLTVAGLALVLSAWRLLARRTISGMANALYLFLSAIMVVCMIFGADLGGLMVYGHGVAVRELQQPDVHHHHGEPMEEDH